MVKGKRWRWEWNMIEALIENLNKYETQSAFGHLVMILKQISAHPVFSKIYDARYTFEVF